MNFKEFFQQVNEDAETVDKSHYDNWPLEKRSVDYEDSDARAFIIIDDSILLATTTTKYHGGLLNQFHAFYKVYPNFKYTDGINNITMDYGAIKVPVFLKGPPPPTLVNDKSINSRSPFLQKTNGIMGRVWIKNNICSFWCNKEDLDSFKWGKIQEVMDFYNVDPKKVFYEVGGNELFSFSEMDQLLNKSQTPIVNTEPQEWQKKLHMISPNLKGNMMKMMGYQPKPAKDIQSRYAMGEQTNFKEFFQLINEMRERFPESEGRNIIAHRGNIWRFEDVPSESMQTDIIEHIGIEQDDKEWYDVEQYIIEERPDVFIGNITSDKYLESKSWNEFTHSSSSPLIKQLINHFKLYGFRIDDEEGYPLQQYHRSELKGQYPDVAYHGTNIKALQQIIKYGLNPSEGNSSNWPFRFNDKIYMTVNKNLAIFHANNSANKQKSQPILLKIRIPDKNKITIDYDVAKTYGLEADSDEEGYGQRIKQHTSSHDIKRMDQIKKHSAKTNFTKVSGVFAYKGRIPVKFIEWIGYKNDEELGLNNNNLQVLQDKDQWPKFVEMMDNFNFYDPDYEEETYEEQTNFKEFFQSNQ
jgi:hypothetical protein